MVGIVGAISVGVGTPYEVDGSLGTMPMLEVWFWEEELMREV